MAYQYKREPLTPEEANRLVNAAESHEEKLVVWTLLDTGLRVSELAGLSRKAIDWQSSPPRIVVHGKGGPYGKQSKRRVVPLDAGHRVVHELTDGRLTGLRLQMRPPSLRRDPEDRQRAVLVRVLRIGAALRVGDQHRVLFFEGVRDVLEEDQAKDDVLVLRGVHRAA